MDILTRIEQLRADNRIDDAADDVLVDAKNTVASLREVVEEFVEAMQILSYRVGISVNEVAEIMNPIGDKARATLNRKE